MLQLLELVQLAKKHASDKVTSNIAKIKPIALVVIKLHLSEGISKSASQSVTRKFD